MNSKGGGALAPQNGMEIQINGAKAPSPRVLEGSVLALQKTLMGLKSHPQYLYKIELKKKSIVVTKNATTRKFRIVQNSVVSNFFTTKI